MKKIKVLLWLCMCVILMGSAATVKAEDSAGATAFTQEESYLTRSFLDLKQYLDVGSGITLTENSSSKGILLTGNASIFNQTKIRINRSFQFSGNRVGRLAVNALAGYGNDLKINFYLDDETDSFATITLKKQGRSDGWTKDVCLQTDVLDKNIRGNHNISFTVTTEDSGAVAVLLRSIEFVESDLPTLYVDVNESLGSISDMNSAQLPDKVECYGDMKIETPEGYSYEFGAASSAQSDLIQNYDMDYIRTTDYSSLGFTKKSAYEFSLADSQSILGMDSGKKWTLFCSSVDNSRLRNQISFWLGRQLGMEYTPECVQVDLVMNGVYYGTYLLTQAIDPEENRPEIQEDGYMLSVTNLVTSATDKDFSSDDSVDAYIEYPRSKDSASVENIRNDFQKIENLIVYNDDKDVSTLSWEKYVDIDSMIDNAWILIASKDSYGTSRGCHYLYKNKDGKIHFSPLWNMEQRSWGNKSVDTDLTSEGFDEGNDSWTWLNELLKYPAFSQKFVNRWPTVRAKLLECIKDGGTLDQYYDQLKISERYDEEKWGMYIPDDTQTDSTDSDPDAYDNLESYATDSSAGTITFAGEKETIRTFVKERIAWIDANLQSFQKQPCKLTFKVNGKTYTTKTVLYGSNMINFPEAPAKKGYVFQGWSYYSDALDSTEYATETSYFEKDTTLTAVYVTEKSIVQPVNLYLEYQEIYVSKNTDNILLNHHTYPSNATGSVSITSSDSNVVEYDKDIGVLKINSTGDATITYTVGKLTSSCLIHVYDPDKEEISSDKGVSIVGSSFTLNIGKWKRIQTTTGGKIYSEDRLKWFSLNESVATVDDCGVVTAVSAGTTYIYLKDQLMNKLTKCKVTVPAAKSSVKKGYSYYYKGLRYKVTYKAKKGGNVTVLGSNSKKIKSVNIRSTLTIKGETYKVTAISAKAFYKCKKLRKIYLGSNLKSIGNKAFTGIYKKAVFKAPASKKKAYKKLLTSRKGFRKTMKVKTK